MSAIDSIKKSETLEELYLVIREYNYEYICEYYAGLTFGEIADKFEIHLALAPYYGDGINIDMESTINFLRAAETRRLELEAGETK